MSQVHLSANSPCVSRVPRSLPELLLYQTSAPLRTGDPALAAWKALTHHLTPQVSSLPCKWKTLCALNPARACVPDFTTAVLLPRVAHLPKTHSPLGRGTPPKAPVCTDSQLPCHAAAIVKRAEKLGRLPLQGRIDLSGQHHCYKKSCRNFWRSTPFTTDVAVK